MASPRFVSPGAMGGNALQQFLMQRELDERTRVEEEFRRKQAAEQLALQQQQEQRIGAAQTEAQTNLEKERQFRRASTIHANALPGVLDPGTADLLRGEGFGDIVQEGQSVDALAGTVTPGVLQTSGGTAYQQARMAAQERAAQAQQAQQAAAERAAEAEAGRNERAQESNALRATLAGAMNAGRAETTGLRNDLLQTQIAAANQKAADKHTADKRAKDAARITSQATIDVVKQLADFDASGKAKLKPGTANLYGLRNPLAQIVPGSDTANAKAARDRLSGRVIVDLLNEMKNQSATGATGFGALSGPELRLLENASTQLSNPNISDQRAAEELERIYNMAKRLYGNEPTDAAAAPVQKWGRDAQGRPVRLP